jgi:hypothetical protein
MSQHDLILDNGSGAAFRADANNALAALGSNMKGPNAPAAPFAGMLWWDDDTPSASIWTLRGYDGADWIEIGRLNVTTNVFTVAEGSFAPVDIASAATTDIGASASPNVRVTGTTPITSLGTAPAGTRRFLTFAAVLTITYNATSLQTPGLANIITAAGDNAVARSLGSGNWVIESYTRAAGLPIGQIATSRVLGRRSAGTGALEDIPVGNDASGISLAINRGTEQATTSGTQIDFTSIPAGVRRITVMFDGVSFNGGDGASIQLGDSGGIETTGYSGVTGISVGVSTGTGAGNSTGVKVIYDGVSASDNCSGVVTIVNQSGNKWLLSGLVSRNNGSLQVYTIVGSKPLSDVLDRLRFKIDGASSFDAGTINIMWEF